MEKKLTTPGITEQKRQIHDCLLKLVEIKLILQDIADPSVPKESVWNSNDVGGFWSELRTNITSIYIDFLELEARHE